MRRNRIPYPTWGRHPEACAHDAAAMALTMMRPVFWNHENRFKYLVKPGMTGKMVYEVFEQKSAYTHGIVVRCIDETIEDASRFMNKIDIELRKLGIAKFILCCDVMDDCCSSSVEPKALPYPFPDGSYLIGLKSLGKRVQNAVIDVLSRYPEVELA